MEPVFKVAEITDVDMTLEMMRDFYAHEGLSFNEAVAREALKRLLIDDSFGCVWLIYLNGEIAGYMVLCFGYSLEFHGRDAFIDEIYLLPDYRGKGVAGKAIEFLEAACRNRGITAIHLEVERANTRAQSAYRKAGFADHDRYLMTKWISQKDGENE